MFIFYKKNSFYYLCVLIKKGKLHQKVNHSFIKKKET